MYGPTECTTYATGHLIEEVSPTAQTVPIGRPISNTEAYVLDARREPVPVGVPGELYLGGPGLALGYLHRPELTEDRFVRHPFSDDPQARLYRTGDAVRRLADGAIEYLGRLDQQVKVRGYRIELEEIEAVLEKHAAVRQAVVVAREDSPGDKRLVAYIAAGQKGPSDAAPGGEQVAHWERIYDEVYRRGANQADPMLNLVGWNSSYTGQPLPAEEMREWIDQTVTRILSLPHDRVLEIGCGTGLLLLRVAGECRSYCGTDLSNEALRSVERSLAVMAVRPNVTLLATPAHDLARLEAGSFDLVVINSVAQYFPSVDYFLEVVRGALAMLRPGGAIFLGDIRDQRLLPALHASLELHKASDGAPCAEILTRTRQAVEQEQELCLDPRLFAELPNLIAGVADAEVMLKRGASHNELTKYRYDVVIRARGGEARDSRRASTCDAAAPALDAIRQALANGQTERLLVRGVENTRIAQDALAWRWLAGDDAPATVGELRERFAHEAAGGLEPDSLYAIADEHDCDLSMTWHDGACDERFDAIFVRRGGDTPSKAGDDETDASSAVRWQDYATDPRIGSLTRRLVPELRGLAQSKLPEYMHPSAYVLLDAIPLNANGKVDRRALPAPAAARPSWSPNYTAPRNELETRLVAIWEELLGVRPVGIHDSFFDLGGHSMLALRLIAEIEKLCGRKPPLSVLFEGPTIAHLAEMLSRADAAPPTLVPLKPVGQRPPLFVVHPGGGTVFCYRGLAQHLSNDQPLVAFQAQGLDGREAPHATIEEMAAHYVGAMRQARPQGPYRLAGWSLGGNVAYEMACQLEAAGETVELLLLLDSGAASADRPPSEDDLGRLLIGLFPTNDQMPIEAVKALPAAQQVAWFVERANQAQLVGFTGQGTQSEAAVYGVFKANLEALAAYRPKVYGGKVTLLRARDQVLDQGRDPLLGWGDWAAGGVEVHEVAGDHVQMLREPLVADVAKIIDTCAERLACDQELPRQAA